jgi:hypothetical protein
MRAALAQEGAMLVLEQRVLSCGYFIQQADGSIERCTMRSRL